MLLVLSLVLAAMPPSPCLQLSLAVPKREILAGEATTAIVTAHAVCDLEAPGFRPSLQIDDGTGFRPFMDVQDDDGCVFDITRSIKAGSWARALRRLAVSENEPGFQLAFPKAGTYRVQASWRGVRSNVVHVIAVEPQGEDARVLEELGKAPELLSWIGFMDRPEKARDLVARYPASHYLVPVRIMLWQMEAVEAERRDEFGSMRFPTARTVAVLDQVESAEPSGTPFDLDRLLLVWTHRTVASDSAGATRVSERITREYPDSHNADWDYAARLAEAQERASHTGSSLGLELSAAKGRLLVGEAQKLTLSWIARRPTTIHPETVRLLVDDGDGFKQYTESAIAQPFLVRVGELIVKPDDPYRTTHVMAVSGGLQVTGERDFRFAFSRPGRYRITAQYWSGQGRGRALHFSNDVLIWVSEPRGRDGELFRDVLRPRPELLTEWAFADGFAEASDIEAIGRLLREHEGSRYLPRIRDLYWQRRLQDAFRQRGLGGRPLTDEDRALLDEAEAEPANSDPFYADRLLTVAALRGVWGDSEGAARSYRKLLAESPDSETADRARSWLAAHER